MLFINLIDLKRGLANLCFLHTLLIVMTTAVFAQQVNNNIAPELLQQDLRVLQDSLQRLHPGLYRYKSKTEIDNLFKNANAKVSRPMPLLSYYALIRYVISEIKDGHTSVFLPSGINKAFLAQAKLFPIWLHFIGDKAFTYGAANGLPAGTIINKVDHKNIRKLRQELFRYISSDGNDQSVKYADMNTGESPFCYLYFLVYGEKSSFEINYTRPDGISGDTVLQAVLLGNIQLRPKQQKITQFLKLSYTPDSIAIMSVKTFLNSLLDETHENFQFFMQSAFRELADKHVKKLVIDVRDNGGGHDINGIILDSYLTDRAFHYVASIRSTNGEITGDNDLALQRPAADHFQGKVFILMNGKSFSTAADFCAVAQNISNAKVVGEESGGGYHGTTSGPRSTLYLPNTQIRVNIPLWESFNSVRPVKYKDRGVMPDYLVIPTIDNVLQNKDVQLDFALKMARR
jgi:hypothetical protein